MKRLVVVAVLCALAACAGPTDYGVSVDAVSADGRTLTLTISSCGANARVTVDEKPDRVILRARGGRSRNDCAEGAVVTLREPLGDREVIDFRSGLPLQLPATRGR